MEQWLVQNISILIPGVGFTGLIAIWVLIKNPKILDALRTKNHKTLSQDDEEEEDEPHIHHRIERRRTSDIILDRFLDHAKSDSEFQARQTVVLERLSEIHHDTLKFLQKMDERMEDNFERIGRELRKSKE